MEFLSLEGIKEAIAQEIEVMEELADDWDMCSSFPEGHIKQVYVNPNWIPLFHGGGGSYIGLDLDPDKKGIIGQLINFGVDDEDKFVYSDSLNNFISECYEKMESGERINYNEEYKMYFYTDLAFGSALAKEIIEKNA